MKTPYYPQDTFGYWSGPTFNAKFQVAFPGWAAEMPAADLNPTDIGLLGHFTKPGGAQAGTVIMMVGLPNAHQGCALQLEIMVSTTTIGYHLHRAPTVPEMKALRREWWTLRDTILTTYEADDRGLLPLADAVAAFARAEPLFLSDKIRIRTDPNEPYALLWDRPGPADRIAPALPPLG
jgi:hypothetical protein